MTEEKEPTSPIADYLNSVDTTHQDTKTDRDMLRDKLRSYLSTITLSAVNPKSMEGVLIAVDVFNKLLKDTDGQAETRAKLHIANKKADQADASASLVAAYIKQLHTQQIPVPGSDQPDDSDSRIEDIFSKSCSPIKDSELL